MSQASAVESLLFAALAKLTAAERNAFLDSACAGDPELRRQVEKLLQAHANAGDFLQKPVVEQMAASPDPNRTTDHDPNSASAAPDVIPAHELDTSTFGPAGPHVPAQDAGPQALAISGYEIEDILGRGGMGVVYRARHLALKRTVALKMILGGGHAGPGALARFKVEAEAVARLQHPNIVQIHEVGEADGHPYCALELVEGGSLAGKISHRPLPARDAAKLVEALARAMQLAHSRNVVHRDLKPANVLLTADGAPKITDFGLARQLDSDSSETQAGAIMGTPSYMAPEQASGRAHEAGPAADVYALGAILYECLTGRPPFKGQTIVETLDQVRTQEPVPPSQLAPRESRGANWPDLETICLKCLRKEPENRYASAGELADDLVRYQHGEPIRARAVSGFERAIKWVKRNPVVTGAAVAVVLALVVGTTVSTLKYREAESARNELATQNTALEQKQDQLEGMLAQTWLTPLAEATGPLNDAEIGAFTKVAAVRNQSLAERFLTEALSSGQGRRQLRARSAFAFHAAVGLDLRNRQEVERLLIRALEMPDLADAAQTDLALATVSLGGLSSPAAARVAQTLIQALIKTDEPNAQRELAGGLNAVSAHLEAKEAAEVAATLTQTMRKTTDSGIPEYLLWALPTVVARMEPKEAAALLAQAIGKTRNAFTVSTLTNSLVAVLARLEAKEAAAVSSEVAATISRSMSKTTDANLMGARGWVLSTLSAHLDPKEAAAGAAALLQVMTRANDLRDLETLALCLSAVMNRMDPEEAARLSAQAAVTFLQMMTSPDSPLSFAVVARGVQAVAPHLKPRDAAEAATRLTQALIQGLIQPPGKRRPIRFLPDLGLGLSAVMVRLEPREAAAIAATLTQAMTRTNDPQTLNRLAAPLSSAVTRLEPREAARVSAEAAATFTQALNKASDLRVLAELARGLSSLAVRLGPREAADVCNTLTQAMSRTNESFILVTLAESLTSVAARLETTEAARIIAEAIATLTQAMSQVKDVNNLPALAEILCSVAARLEPRAAAAALTQVTSKTEDINARETLVRGLKTVVARLEPREATEVAAALAEAMKKANKPNDYGILLSLAEVLSAVEVRLDPSEAIATLTQAMTRTNDPFILGTLAQGLSSVAGRLKPREVAHVSALAVTLAEAMTITRTNDGRPPLVMAQGLQAVAVCLEPREAGQVVAILTQALNKANNPVTIMALAQALSAVAVRLEPREAVTTLTQVITTTKNPHALRDLAHALSVAVVRLEPREAARVSAEAAALLRQAMTRLIKGSDPKVVTAPDPWELASLARALSSAAANLEPREASRLSAEAAVALTQDMTTLNDAYALQALSDALSAVVVRLQPSEAAEVSATLAQAMTRTTVPSPVLPIRAEGGGRVVPIEEPRPNDPLVLPYLQAGLSLVAGRLEPREAARAATTLTHLMTRTMNPSALEAQAKGLSAILGHRRGVERARAVAATVAAARETQGLIGTLALLHLAAEPGPRGLSDQELVELLQQPLCVDSARRAILDHLGHHHRRTFADQWDFVRYAEEKRLSLDFTTPLRR